MRATASLAVLEQPRATAANGIAACLTHDKALDAGLLWVNGGYRIHTVEALDATPGMTQGWRRRVLPLSSNLLVPGGVRPPGAEYLAWPRNHVIAA